MRKPAGSRPGAGSTHCGTDFHTWWHTAGEVNTQTPVDPASVRQSHRYWVQVRRPGGEFADSFVYEAVPRSGKGRVYSPWDAARSNTLPASVDDGISIEVAAGITMAWSQFLYSEDVDVKILRRDGAGLGSPSAVVIRPTSVRYELSSTEDGGVLIRVPADPCGRKFSVEFDDDLFEYRSDGRRYVHKGGSIVGIEPKNALLIFASPFLPDDLLPSMTPENTWTMTPGPIYNGDWGSLPILYFPPGVYWLNQAHSGAAPKLGENHIRLHPNTFWVHFAPGAFVKGAIEFSTLAAHFYVTGHGTLSGEHYVYQANPASFYQAVKSDADSLRMWGHKCITAGQTWHCAGPTVASPPFNTHDFFGSDEISVRISDYKQVGAFFFQTDGPQLYPNSVVTDVFYHVNDDAIKAYHSNVSLSRATVWKCHNDPVIQMGWAARDVHGVTIDRLSVIHTRHIRSEMYVPSAIIGASPFYNRGAGAVDPSKSISITVSNLVCEGPCPALLRITPLQSYASLVIRGAAFPDGLLPRAGGIGAGESRIPASGVPNVRMQLDISDWTVGGRAVNMSNFHSDSLGQFNIDASYWGQWRIR